MDLNDQILDRMLSHFLGVESVKNGLIRKYAKILSQYDEQIIGMFSRSFGKVGARRAAFERLVKDLKKKAHSKYQKEVLKDMNELIRRESGWVVTMLSGFLGKKLVNEAAAGNLDKIMSSSRVRGFRIPDFIKGLEAKDVDQFLSTAAVSVFDGLTLEQSIKDLEEVNKRRSRSMQSTIRTLAAHIKSEADRSVFQANKHLIDGEMLSVVFDTRTSPICIIHAEEQKVYPVGQAPRPPFHYNCRTMIIPVLKSIMALRKADRRFINVDARVSMRGTIPQSFSFTYWLRRQSLEDQVELLGYRRARLFRKGKMSVSQLIEAATGRFIPMDDYFQRFGT
jgi:hypothetical protein